MKFGAIAAGIAAALGAGKAVFDGTRAKFRPPPEFRHIRGGCGCENLMVIAGFGASVLDESFPYQS